MDEPVNPATGTSMQAEIERLNKVVQALMDRAERNVGIQGSDYNLFQTTVTLEEKVRRRTAELEAALLENQKITRALHESEDHYRAFFLGSSVPMLLIDPADGRIVDANAASEKYYGYTLIQLRGMNFAQINTMMSEEVVQEMAAAAQAKKVYFNFRHRLASGEVRDVEVHSGAVNLKDHRLLYFIVHDITERLNAEKIVKEQIYFIEQLIDAIPNPVFYKDVQGCYLGCNKAFEQFIGSPRQEMVGKSVYDLSPKELADRYYSADKVLLDKPGLQSYEAKVQSADGKLKDVLFNKATFNKSDGSLGGLVGVILDITERKKVEDLIHDLAFNDELTGLPNRRLLSDRMNQAMAASKRSGRYGAVMFLDMDNFKPLNDAHGHDMGDLLLIEVAHRISGCIREIDTVARFGGDEFVVMLSELDVNREVSANLAATVAEKIHVALAEPYLLKHVQENGAEARVEHHCTASIGVVLYLDHEASREDILKWADMAMYQAKAGGRNSIRFFDGQS